MIMNLKQSSKNLDRPPFSWAMLAADNSELAITKIFREDQIFKILLFIFFYFGVVLCLLSLFLEQSSY